MKTDKLQCVTGIIYNPGSKPYTGYLCWKNGKIVELGKGKPPSEPAAKGIITPLFLNGHTHIGDSFLAGKIDMSVELENIVTPPNGLKHQLLARTGDKELRGGMVRSMKKMTKSGTGGFIDYRENGLKGVKLLDSAVDSFELNYPEQPIPKPIILSRPKSLNYKAQQVRELLDNSSGLGISAMKDWEYSELQKLARDVHSKGKILSLHASEAEREDMDKILNLKPDILVHLSSAEDSDLEIVADTGTHVVVCPQSNSMFGLKANIPRMLELKIPVSIGTDNAMFVEPNLFDTMKFVHTHYSKYPAGKSRKLTVNDILNMTGKRMKKVLNVKSGISLKESAGFMVIPWKTGKIKNAADEIIQAKGPSLIVTGNKIKRRDTI